MDLNNIHGDPIAILNFTHGQPVDLAVDGDLLAIAVEYDGLYLYDTSLRHAPEMLSHVGIPEENVALNSGRFSRIEIRGSLLYVAAKEGGVLIYDINDPTAPSLLCAGNTELAFDVELIEDALAVTGDDGIMLFETPFTSIIDIYPGPGDVKVPTDAVLKVRFSRNVFTDNLSLANNFRVYVKSDENETQIPGELTYPETGTYIVHFTPEDGFVPGQQYTLELTTGITDEEGGKLLAPVKRSFRITPGGASVPEITSVDPYYLFTNDTTQSVTIHGTGFENPSIFMNGQAVVSVTENTTNTLVMTPAVFENTGMGVLSLTNSIGALNATSFGKFVVIDRLQENDASLEQSIRSGSVTGGEFLQLTSSKKVFPAGTSIEFRGLAFVQGVRALVDSNLNSLSEIQGFVPRADFPGEVEIWAVLPDGFEVQVGLWNYTLEVGEVIEINTEAQGLRILENVAYTSGETLRLFDLSIPSRATEIGRLEDAVLAQDLYAVDDMLIGAAGGYGISVYDISNFEHIFEVDQLSMAGNVTGLEYVGGEFYASVSDFVDPQNSHIQVIDPSGPSLENRRLVQVEGDLLDISYADGLLFVLRIHEGNLSIVTLTLEGTVLPERQMIVENSHFDALPDHSTLVVQGGLAYLNVGKRVLVINVESKTVVFYAAVENEISAFDLENGTLYINNGGNITPIHVPRLGIEQVSPVEDGLVAANQKIEVHFSRAINPYSLNEDIDNDGVLDGAEDINSDGILNPGEDLNGNGELDLAEDQDADGIVDSDLRVYLDINENGSVDEGVDTQIEGDVRVVFTATASYAEFVPLNPLEAGKSYIIRVVAPSESEGIGIQDLDTLPLTAGIETAFEVVSSGSDEGIVIEKVVEHFNVSSQSNLLRVSGRGMKKPLEVSVAGERVDPSQVTYDGVTDELLVTIPALDGRDYGMASVSLRDSEGMSDTYLGSIVYVPSLKAFGVSTNVVSPNGGDRITLTGSGFIPGRTSVFVNGELAEGLVVESLDKLSFLVPPGEFGNAEIRIEVDLGATQNHVVLRDALTYSLPTLPSSNNLDLGNIREILTMGSYVTTLSINSGGESLLQNTDVSDAQNLVPFESGDWSFVDGRCVVSNEDQSRLFVGDGNRLTILNTSNPDALDVVESILLAVDSTVQSISISGDLMGVATNQGLLIYAKPGSDHYLKIHEIPIEGGVSHVDIEGNLLFYTYASDTASFVSVRDLNSEGLSVLGAYELVSSPVKLQVDASTVYVGCEDPALVQIIDFSEPSLPVARGRVIPREEFFADKSRLSDFHLSGTTMFMANYEGGVQVFDISSFATPRFIQYVNTPNEATSVASSESFVYIGTSQGDLLVASFFTPSIRQVYPNHGERVPVDSVIKISFNTLLETGFDETLLSVLNADGMQIEGTYRHLIENNGSVLCFTPAENLEVDSDYEIKLTAGLSDIAGRTLESEFSSRFKTATSATSSQPIMEEISSSYGHNNGGQEVIIQGEGFQEGIEVYFGTNRVADEFVEISHNGTILKVISPAGSDIASISVVNPGGLSDTLLFAFFYIGDPQIVSISPDHGLLGGGHIVEILGHNFFPGSTVLFEGKEASNTNVVCESQILCEAPEGIVGYADVDVVNVLDTPYSVSAQQGYLYQIQGVTHIPNACNLAFEIGSTGVPSHVYAYNETNESIIRMQASQPLLQNTQQQLFDASALSPVIDQIFANERLIVTYGNTLSVHDPESFDQPKILSLSKDTNIRALATQDRYLVALNEQLGSQELLIFDLSHEAIPLIATQTVDTSSRVIELVEFSDGWQGLGLFVVDRTDSSVFHLEVVDILGHELQVQDSIAIPSTTSSVSVYKETVVALQADQQVAVFDLQSESGEWTYLGEVRADTATLRAGILYAASAHDGKLYDVSDISNPRFLTDILARGEVGQIHEFLGLVYLETDSGFTTATSPYIYVDSENGEFTEADETITFLAPYNANISASPDPVAISNSELRLSINGVEDASSTTEYQNGRFSLLPSVPLLAGDEINVTFASGDGNLIGDELGEVSVLDTSRMPTSSVDLSITSISPRSVFTGASTQTFTVMGTNLHHVDRLNVGGIVITDFTSSASDLSFDWNSIDEGFYPVTLIQEEEGQVYETEAGYVRTNDPLIVDSIVPLEVGYLGGEIITVQGDGFTRDTVILVAGVETSLTSYSAELIEFRIPQGGSDSLDIHLNRPGVDSSPILIGSISRIDNEPAQVLSVVPSDHSRSLATNTEFTITFTEPVNSTAIDQSLVLREKGGNILPVVYEWNVGGDAVTLRPVALSESTVYQIEFNEISDLAGNSSEANQAFIYDYLTIDTSPPHTVEWVSPADDSDFFVRQNISFVANVGDDLDGVSIEADQEGELIEEGITRENVIFRFDSNGDFVPDIKLGEADSLENGIASLSTNSMLISGNVLVEVSDRSGNKSTSHGLASMSRLRLLLLFSM